LNRTPNDQRSPDGGPIAVRDQNTHIFSEDYYFYVTLVVLDEDVDDGYPTTQLMLMDGTDADCVEIDLR
jgi:hypothetical protein